MAVNYTDVQKTEKYISRTNFDALEMAAVPEGTEFNIVDQIHESDLDSDVLQKLNNNAKINTANTLQPRRRLRKISRLREISFRTVVLMRRTRKSFTRRMT